MYAAAAASRLTLFSEPASKTTRLNYEGDVKTLQNNRLGFDIMFDLKTGMPKGVSIMPQQKPFCKVCHDAGKSEVIYTSHYVRASPSPDAPVVCPTLLAQPCRYCLVPGHTVKYCPKLSVDQPEKTHTHTHTELVKHTKHPNPNAKGTTCDIDRTINRFSALAIDSVSSSDEDSDVEKQSVSDMVIDQFEEIKNLSLQTLSTMLSSILQMNPSSDNKLVIAIENAIANKTAKFKARPPFCSPLPVAFKPEIEKKPATDTTSQQKQNPSKSWADIDENDEIDFTADLPNFPPLPPPSLKRSYSDITRE